MHITICAALRDQLLFVPLQKKKVSPNWTWLLFQQAEGLIWKTKATHPLSVISLNQYYVIYSTEQLITFIFWVQILSLQTSLTFLSNGAILHLCTGEKGSFAAYLAMTLLSAYYGGKVKLKDHLKKSLDKVWENRPDEWQCSLRTPVHNAGSH